MKRRQACSGSRRRVRHSRWRLYPRCEAGNSTRRASNKDFLVALARDFQAHGEQVLARVRRESPAAYLKVCAMLVPREMKIEHSGGVKSMTDEQLEQGIEAIQAMLAAKDAGASAKVIEGKVEPVPGPPKAQRKRRKTDADVVEDVGSDADGANS